MQPETQEPSLPQEETSGAVDATVEIGGQAQDDQGNGLEPIAPITQAAETTAAETTEDAGGRINGAP